MILSRLATASALLVIAATSCIPSENLPTPRPDHPQVVLLSILPSGVGSGVVIADDWLLTCKHCVPVHMVGDLPATHHIVHPVLDLALVKVPGLKSNGLRFGDTPAMHDSLAAYGWHLGKHFLRTDGHQGGNPGGMSAPIIHGCSGGAVVDSMGDLVGIITWVVYTGTWSGQDGVPLPHVSGYTPVGEPERIWIANQIERNR